jgi:ribosome-binding factor A
MSSRRAERVASVLQEEVSRRLLTEVKDPRVGVISITGVAVSPDLSVARIRYLPLGGVGNRAQIQAGLNDAARQLRGPVGRALGVRHAPELRFEIDRNIEYAAHMDEVLRNLPRAPDDPEPGEAGEAAGEGSEGAGDAPPGREDA